MIEQVFKTSSAEETIAAGRSISASLKPPLMLILRGDLGAGKTTLVKGIIDALGAGAPEDVTSPTFTLVHEYDVPSRFTKLYHLDLYRLEEDRQLAVLGIDEMLDSRAILLIEWGEKFSSILSRADGEIVLTHNGGDLRTVNVRYRS
jgi:tRNA threonylcarbamoyladenosine biosynthesis protein TsaE